MVLILYSVHPTTPMTTATLQEQAQKNISDAVLNHTRYLCLALKQNYIDSAIKLHQRNLTEYGGDRCDVSYAPYHVEQIEKLKQGICDYDFIIETGRKYHKIIMVIDGSQQSVHAFIDKQTGQVYKSASWKSPAKGVRYDLRIMNQREWLYANADWAGGYLYMK